MEMTWAIIKMILVLGTILLALFFLSRLVRGRRMGNGGGTDSGIRVLASQCLAPQKYISLVEVGGEVLALGISEHHISLLTKVENREFIQKISSRIQSQNRPENLFLFPSFQSFIAKAKEPKGGWLRRVYGK